jgi:hypothetical protein
MTALTRNPANINQLQSTKFRLVFNRLPGMTYFCQQANLPGISLTEIMRPTPFVDLYSPGEKLLYETLNITFVVDEDLYAWTEIHDWMRGLTFPTKFEEYIELQRKNGYDRVGRQLVGEKDLSFGQFTDATLTLHTNKNNPNFRVKFVDIFPVALSTLVFNTGDSAENIITADAAFRYSYFNYERI